jgi:hypothetical protein
MQKGASFSPFLDSSVGQYISLLLFDDSHDRYDKPLLYLCFSQGKTFLVSDSKDKSQKQETDGGTMLAH